MNSSFFTSSPTPSPEEKGLLPPELDDYLAKTIFIFKCEFPEFDHNGVYL
jgi:hypothetical protein